MYPQEAQRTAGGWAVALLLGAVAGALIAHGGVTHMTGPLLATLECNAPQPLVAAASTGVHLSADVAAFVAASGNVSANALGERARFATVEWLLEKNGALKKELAASRRQFLWQAKTKMAQVKGLLKALKAEEDRKALHFVLDDRAAPDGQGPNPQLRDLQALERKAVVKQFQEVDQATNPNPMPVSVRSLKESIQRGQKLPLWPAIEKCSDAVLQVSKLAAQQARLAQATLDAQTQLELVTAAQVQIPQIWRGAAEWVVAWRDAVNDELIQRYVVGDDAQKRQRSEVTFWGLALDLMWPLFGAPWSRVPGPSQAELEAAGTQGRDLLVGKLQRLQAAWNQDIQDLAARTAAADKLLHKAMESAQSACGVPKEQLQSVQLAASGNPLGPCASPQLGAPGGAHEEAPLASASVWKREWTPDPWSELEFLGQAVSVPAETGSARGPVNASLLVVLQYPTTIADQLTRLFEPCTRGLWGEGKEGTAYSMTSEVLVAVDASMRELVTRVLADMARPWFLTRVVFVSTGGVGLTTSRGYNVLASLARGEVIILYEGDFATNRPEDCEWLHKIVRPFSVWPRLAVVGQWKGHMAMFQTPGADFLDVERSSGEPVHNRLKDPLLSSRLQFLLGTFHAPMAFRRSMFLAVGGFDSAAAGASNMLLEYALCRRLWLSGLQVTMAQVLWDFRVTPAHKSEFMDQVWREQAVGDLHSHMFPEDLESRIVGEVKRMNRFLKPIAIWE